MDFFETVTARFSYRKNFDPAPVPLEDLKTIVQTGLDAPSGVNAQTTGFVIIRDPEIVQAVRDLPQANRAMASAPAYIACHIARRPEETYQGLSFEAEDCAAAVENMLLAVSALGYGSVWIDGWLRREDRARTLGRLVGLEEDRVIRIILPVGRMAETQRRPPKKAFGDRVRIL